MNFSTSLATLRPELGGSLMEYDLEMSAQGFVGHQIFPVFEAGRASGSFGRIPIEQLLKTMPTERAPGAAYNRSVWKAVTDSYSTQEHGHESPIDDQEADLYRDYFDSELISAARARRIVMQNAEIRAAALIQDTATFTPTGVANGKEWDVAAAAIPLTDVENAINRLWAKGIIANALIITRNQFRKLRFASQIIDKVSSGGAGDRVLPGDINVQHLRVAFDLPNIIVAGAIQNTAQEGQTLSVAGVWSDEYAAVTRIAQSRDIQEPCVGRTFHYGGDGSQIGGLTESYRDESVRSDIIRIRHQVTEKRLYEESVELLDNVIA